MNIIIISTLIYNYIGINIILSNIKYIHIIINKFNSLIILILL